MNFGLEQEGVSLITHTALAHPLHPINSRSRNNRRNLWVGRCVSSWWPLLSPRHCVNIHLSIRMHSLYEFCYRTYICIHKCCSVLVKLHPTPSSGLFLGVGRSCVECHFSLSLVSPILSCSRINSLILGCRIRVTFGICFKQHFDTVFGVLQSITSQDIFAPGPSFRISLWRLVSWINHLSRVCLSTFW